MKIFVLAYYYLGLEIPILEELQKQGHHLFVLEDKQLPTDCYLKEGGKRLRLRNYILKQYNSLFHVYQRYWNKKIKRIKELNQSYDCFICIQGQSFHPKLINHLRNQNPQIKSILYLWDTNEFYDYVRNLNFFDCGYSFDYRDCTKYEGLRYLPFYWVNRFSQEKLLYDLSIVGSDHDGRFEIVEKLYPSIKKNLSSYVKIVLLPEPFYGAPKWYKKYFCLFKKKRANGIICEWNYKNSQEFTTTEPMPYDEVEKIISQSRCILDTDRESQFGTTPRLIWALASGKKIITTNINIKNLPFYNEKQIKIIDRNSPVLDIGFILRDELFSVSEYVQELRIDKWVKKLLEKTCEM